MRYLSIFRRTIRTMTACYDGPQRCDTTEPLLALPQRALIAGLAVLTLPFAESLVTIGSTIHGGAIASLIDTAATVAAWSDNTVPENMRGTTVGLTVTYLAPAEGEDLRATARVLRRGRSLVYLDVEVQSVSGTSVARGLVTYKLG